MTTEGRSWTALPVVVRCRAFCSIDGHQCQVGRDDHASSRHMDGSHAWGEFGYLATDDARQHEDWCASKNCGMTCDCRTVADASEVPPGGCHVLCDYAVTSYHSRRCRPSADARSQS